MGITLQQLALPEQASDSIEDMLAALAIAVGVCPVHTGTTVDSAGQCAICALDQGQATFDAPVPTWVRRAQAGLLPAKSFR